MSVSSLMQSGASGWASRHLIARPIAKFITPFQNATISQDRVSGANQGTWVSAGSSYNSSDYSWNLTSVSANFGGFTAFIDWEVPDQNYDIVFAVACSGYGTVFNNRGRATIGLTNDDYSKFFFFGRDGYESSGSTNWWDGYLSNNSKTETSGEMTILSETSSARTNWYMGFRYSMSDGSFKCYKSYDNGSTWDLIIYGTHANYASMTKVFVDTFRRTGSGDKIALLDADLYKYDIVL